LEFDECRQSKPASGSIEHEAESSRKAIESNGGARGEGDATTTLADSREGGIRGARWRG
jgi:hypothetical protein